MNADPALRQRLILYVNAYNMAGPNFNDFTRFGKVLRACRDYCRVVGAEMYLGTGEAFVPGAAVARTATQRGGCANGVDCMGFVVHKMEQVAPGIGSGTITILGVDEHYKRAQNPDRSARGARPFVQRWPRSGSSPAGRRHLLAREGRERRFPRGLSCEAGRLRDLHARAHPGNGIPCGAAAGALIAARRKSARSW